MGWDDGVGWGEDRQAPLNECVGVCHVRLDLALIFLADA